MIQMLLLILTVGEVISLVVAVKLFGGWITLLLLAVSFWAGAWLLRRQGLATLELFTNRLQTGKSPLREAWDGACIVAAALLLMTPGLFSDLIALLLLLPTLRGGLKGPMLNSRFTRDHYWVRDQPEPEAAPVIDAEWREVDRK